MDEFLNELYGTSQIISGDDLEKQAAAEFLVKLAEQEGVDLDTLSDNEVGELLAHIEGGQVKQAEAEAETQVTEAQEKLAEADFLGRAMAHAYVNELHEIEKQAQSIGPQIGAGRLAYRRLAAALGRGAEAAKGGAKAVGEWTGASQVGSGAKKAVQGLKAHSAQAKQIKKDYGEAGLKTLLGTRSEAAKEGLKELGAGAARMGKRVVGPAAAIETARRIGKAQGSSEKEAKSFDEAFESLARERAYEMLAEAGYDVEKVAQADIDTAALQMLEAAGYPVNWNQG